MNSRVLEMNMAELAKVIPVDPENEFVFAYHWEADAQFDKVEGDHVVKVNLASPDQHYTVARKQGGPIYFGFNVFREGDDIKYQPFVWAGAAPPNAPLASTGSFNCAGPICTLGEKLEEATVKTAYAWIFCTVFPKLCSFQVEAEGPMTIAPDEPNATAQVAKSTNFENDTSEAIVYTPTIEASFEQHVSASATDCHSFEAGANVHVEHSVGWFAGETTFAIDLNFKYGYTHETTATMETGETYGVSETIELEVPAGQSRWVSVIFRADQDATANITVPIKLKGTINDAVQTGEYLKQLVSAQDNQTVFKEVGSDYVIYLVSGEVEASVVQDSDIIVSEDPPSVVGGVLQLPTT